jgi:hypothetical protein
LPRWSMTSPTIASALKNCTNVNAICNMVSSGYGFSAARGGEDRQELFGLQ